MVKRSVLFFCCSLLLFIAQAQNQVRSKDYPQNLFRYPLDLPPTTAGSFGELRPSHFHAGLDFKTLQRTGIPVHAAAEGYVSRLRVQYGGLGNAVYIDHPEGYTSVYGHLDHLMPQLQALVRAEQARQQKFDVDFNPPPFQLLVYKGQVVAWSGNTGASGGPHLHFEIRDTKSEETINAQLFGLTIPDKVPPSIYSVSVYHLNGRPFDENTLRQTYPVAGTGGNCHLSKPQTLELSGQIGFGITADDRNSTSANKNGVFSIELKFDGKTVYTFAVERFAFDQTHAINAYIDYPNYLKSGGRIQKCFILPGARITLYPQSVDRGIITLNDNELHEVEYVVRDVAGNTSTVKVPVRSSIPKEGRPVAAIKGTLLHYDRHNEFDGGKVKLIIEPFNLYDDLDLSFTELPRRQGSYSGLYRFQNRYTPIHDSLKLWIKPDTGLAKYAAKAVVVNLATGAQESKLEDGYVKATIHEFGDFDIRLDTVPPVITPVNIHNGASLPAVKAIYWRVSDNMSGVKSFMGKIDGNWVLIERDFTSKLLSYTFDGSLAAGRHQFQLTVTDYKDNITVYNAEFYR